MSPTPVAGLKVLDLSKVLAGPLCAQYLGDMGADVIKVETTGAGDETRGWPPFRTDADGEATGTVFLSANRNKRSLAIDLRSEAGKAAVLRLVDQSDVVIESFGPGVAQRLGVDAATLRARNPRLVCCSISGFGSVGPMRDGKGYDVILQAFCGMLAITGERDGPPVRSPFSPVDQATGLHALIGILAALLERSRTGVGGTVEASLFDTATGFLGYFLQGYWERGTEPEKPGSGHESLCPYEVFETRDKPLILGVANDGLWRAFCAVAGLQEVMDDPRFATNAARVANREETVALVKRALAGRDRDEWIEALGALGIPCSPLHTLGELSAHPHAAASGMIFGYAHDLLGPMRSVAQPLRFGGERTALRSSPPALGEHGREILREVGYDDERIDEMHATGVIRLPE
ncbi:CaiB/BaiF CoA transferase family protein [Variovorax sp. GT1P44]|uniref:CaiB/BaiF CoA transferase family protein n=1 Tax=Variovorax sp. GT1P44 TaxID=3443742 RepID=UPI003F4640B1